jgi:hypothetical protein
VVEKLRDRHFDIEARTNLVEHAESRHRVTAEREEICFRGDHLDPQNVFPDLRQARLGLTLINNVLARWLGM